MKRRLFVAVPLPGGLVDELVSYSDRFKQKEFRWTSAENLHITVHFIGYVEKEDIPAVLQGLSGDLAGVKKFTLEFDGIVFAPPGKKPRMIWAKFVSVDNSYGELAVRVGETLRRFSGSEARELVPHVTLARFRTPEIAKNIELPRLSPTEWGFDAASVGLMESVLSPGGPKYSTIKSYRLE